jgi:hypothetical protein
MCWGRAKELGPDRHSQGFLLWAGKLFALARSEAWVGVQGQKPKASDGRSQRQNVAEALEAEGLKRATSEGQPGAADRVGT